MLFIEVTLHSPKGGSPPPASLIGGLLGIPALPQLFEHAATAIQRHLASLLLYHLGLHQTPSCREPIQGIRR